MLTHRTVDESGREIVLQQRLEDRQRVVERDRETLSHIIRRAAFKDGRLDADRTQAVREREADKAASETCQPEKATKAARAGESRVASRARRVAWTSDRIDAGL